MPQANSTTSRPRCTSPAASESTLPCSSVIAAAISAFRRFTISRKAKRIPVRRDSEDSDHSSKAAAAAATARSTSPARRGAPRPAARRRRVEHRADPGGVPLVSARRSSAGWSSRGSPSSVRGLERQCRPGDGAAGGVLRGSGRRAVLRTCCSATSARDPASRSRTSSKWLSMAATTASVSRLADRVEDRVVQAGGPLRVGAGADQRDVGARHRLQRAPHPQQGAVARQLR